MAIWVKKRNRCGAYFFKLLPLNKPLILIPFGLVFSTLAGSIFPVFGIFWSKILFVMQPNPLDPESLIEFDKIRENTYIMIGIAVCAFIMPFFARLIWGLLGESMTKNIRHKLYTSLLRKHIGWFDNKENSSGQLTSIIASEAQTLNGVSTEAVGTILESMNGLIVGLVVGLIYSWKISLVAIAASPLMMFGAYVNGATNKGLSNA